MCNVYAFIFVYDHWSHIEPYNRSVSTCTMHNTLTALIYASWYWTKDQVSSENPQIFLYVLDHLTRFFLRNRCQLFSYHVQSHMLCAICNEPKKAWILSVLLMYSQCLDECDWVQSWFIYDLFETLILTKQC